MRSPKNSQTSRLSLSFSRTCCALATLTGIALSYPVASTASELPLGASPTDQAMVRAAVGRLKIPAQRTVHGRRQHFIERCSATLVSAGAWQERSTWIISAWHCFEHYQDLSRSISFTGSTNAAVNARLVRSGGGMRDDWALLRLDRSLPGAVPLANVVSTEGQPLLMAGFPKRQTPEAEGGALTDTTEEIPGRAAHDSGESTTAIPGTAPRTLKLARDCRMTKSIERDVQSDCVLPPGSSGGAVFSINTGLGSRAGVPTRLVYQGVISRGDSTTLSIFVPLKRFQTAVLREMRSKP